MPTVNPPPGTHPLSVHIGRSVCFKKRAVMIISTKQDARENGVERGRGVEGLPEEGFGFGTSLERGGSVRILFKEKGEGEDGWKGKKIRGGRDKRGRGVRW